MYPYKTLCLPCLRYPLSECFVVALINDKTPKSSRQSVLLLHWCQKWDRAPPRATEIEELIGELNQGGAWRKDIIPTALKKIVPAVSLPQTQREEAADDASVFRPGQWQKSKPLAPVPQQGSCYNRARTGDWACQRVCSGWKKPSHWDPEYGLLMWCLGQCFELLRTPANDIERNGTLIRGLVLPLAGCQQTQPPSSRWCRPWLTDRCDGPGHAVKWGDCHSGLQPLLSRVAAHWLALWVTWRTVPKLPAQCSTLLGPETQGLPSPWCNFASLAPLAHFQQHGCQPTLSWP